VTTPLLLDLLTTHRDEIVARFVAEVQLKDLSPPGVPHSLLVDHIPNFLDEIVAELARLDGVRFSDDAVDTSTTARQHGEQRWTLGYDLEGVIREYGVLRHAILESAKGSGSVVTVDEFDVLAKCLSVGVAEAATAYVKYRDEQLDAQKANLEFLAEAGQLLSSSLDYRSTLRRLTGLVVPRLADWCVVQVEGSSVEEMPIAHLHSSKVEMVRDLYRRHPAPTEDQLREASCSSITVPFLVQDTVLGAMTLAYSDSQRHYGEQDLVLATELARRAAVAVDNARLYDLSQKERSRVEAATRAKDEFVAVVSHELRTPLNAVLGWMRLMRGGSLPAEKREHAFDVIERNADALNLLVADLLDISRVITGSVRINPSQIDVSNVIELAIEGVRPAADAKRIRISVEIDQQNSVVRADGDRLQQVVWNLLGNAVKFTPKNGQIAVTLRRVESDLEIVVRDNGEGIDAEFLPYVFESFRQSNSSSSRTHAGLGIGLSIAKHIVELHGGTIRAESAGLGAGATFSLRIPVSPLLSSTFGVHKVPATTERAPSAALPPGLEGIRVLVVDDESDARELVGYVLESCGMEVRLAENVTDALSQLQSYTPQVIISDIGMPEDDGYVLIRAIRILDSEEKKAIPAIALTAFARNEDRTRALVEGFNLHIAKPVEPTRLVQAVAELAGRPQG